MNLLQEVFEKNFSDKASVIRPLSAIYSKAINECLITFLYADALVDIDTDLRTKITEFCENYLGNEANIKVKFKKSYLDELEIKRLVIEFIKNSFNSLFSGLNEEGISSKIDGNNFDISVSIYTTYFEVAEKKELARNLENYFAANFFGHFVVNLLVCQGQECQEILAEQRKRMHDEIVRAENIKPPVERMKITNIVHVIGNSIVQMPCYIRNIKEPENMVTIAGKVVGLTPRTRKNKFTSGENVAASNGTTNNVASQNDSKKDTSASSVESENVTTLGSTAPNPNDVFYSFSVQDASGTMHAVFFPNSLNRTKFGEITEGAEIVAEGEVSEFNSRLSMRVKNISFCKLPETKPEITNYKPVPDNYTYIFPEKMVYTEQSTLFEASSKAQPKFLLDNDIVVLDTETTGLNGETDQIIEIGAVKMCKGEITEYFSTLIDPQMKLSEETIQITGIVDSDVVGKPLISQVIPDFYKFCDKCVLVGYNTPFDYAFIENAAKKIGYHFAHRQLDALILARANLHGLKNYRLKTVAEYLKVPLNNAHRASNDALATAQVFTKLCENIK